MGGAELARVLDSLVGFFTRSLTRGAVGERVASTSTLKASDMTMRLPVPPAPTRRADDESNLTGESEREPNAAALWRDDGGCPCLGAHARGCLINATGSGGVIRALFGVQRLSLPNSGGPYPIQGSES